ncbi:MULTISPECIES: lysozyme inhibitor LprI family protein [Enterobacterales]|uniref:lysozyme inhibitor LprI family protein n=1 Tax=Enterobacterales TaxID=91347 RepID=UPI002ED9CDA6
MKRFYLSFLICLYVHPTSASSVSEGPEVERCENEAKQHPEDPDGFMSTFDCLSRQLGHYQSLLKTEYQHRLVLMDTNDYYDIPESTAADAKSTRTEIKRNFIASQNAWQQYETAFCAAVAPIRPIGHGNALELAQCQITLLKSRIDEIQRMTEAWQLEAQ